MNELYIFVKFTQGSKIYICITSTEMIYDLGKPFIFYASHFYECKMVVFFCL